MVLGEYQEIEFGARRERMQEMIGGMRGRCAERSADERARSYIWSRVAGGGEVGHSYYGIWKWRGSGRRNARACVSVASPCAQCME